MNRKQLDKRVIHSHAEQPEMIIEDHELIEVVRSRIRNGEYSLRGLPSERILAEEIGVSRRIARRVLQHLVDQGVLERGQRGTLQVAADHHIHLHQIAIMIPSIMSLNVRAWINECRRATANSGINLRLVFYNNWDDLALRDALTGMDGIFLLPRADDPPNWFLKRIATHPCRVAVLGLDWSEYEIPSLVLHQPALVWKLLDHLHELGHQTIDYLHFGHITKTNKHYFQRWRSWLEMHQLKGELIHTVPQNRFIAKCSREFYAERLQQALPAASALLCSRLEVAQGVIRALTDVGLTAGRDRSVCTIGGQMAATDLVPSITSFDRPDTVPAIKSYLQWMMDKDGSVACPETTQVDKWPLFIGESTGPAPRFD